MMGLSPGKSSRFAGNSTKQKTVLLVLDHGISAQLLLFAFLFLPGFLDSVWKAGWNHPPTKNNYWGTGHGGQQTWAGDFTTYEHNSRSPVLTKWKPTAWYANRRIKAHSKSLVICVLKQLVCLLTVPMISCQIISQHPNSQPTTFPSSVTQSPTHSFSHNYRSKLALQLVDSHEENHSFRSNSVSALHPQLLTIPFNHWFIHSVTHSLTLAMTHSSHVLNHTHACTQSLTHLLVLPVTHWFTHTLTLTLWVTCLITHSLNYSTTHSLAYSPTNTITHLLSYPLTHPLNHFLTPPTHSFNHSLNFSLIHSLSHWPTDSWIDCVTDSVTHQSFTHWLTYPSSPSPIHLCSHGYIQSNVNLPMHCCAQSVFYFERLKVQFGITNDLTLITHDNCRVAGSKLGWESLCSGGGWK